MLQHSYRAGSDLPELGAIFPPPPYGCRTDEQQSLTRTNEELLGVAEAKNSVSQIKNQPNGGDYGEIQVTALLQRSIQLGIQRLALATEPPRANTSTAHFTWPYL